MIGFILTTYDRIDDFLVHLDILKHYKFEHEVIPIYMKKEMPKYFMDEIKKYKYHSYCDGVCFNIGPLIALCHGLKIAKDIGLKWVVYRNGDDWLFNDNFVLQVKNAMNDYLAAAYNWLTVDSTMEFALNELWLNVDVFSKAVDEAENYFRKSTKSLLCEVKMARYLRSVLKDWKYLYRLPNREQYPGIGYEPQHINFILEQKQMPKPKNLDKDIKNNNRFFCKKWQLIGSHDNEERYNYYKIIRNEISYVKELENSQQFKRWLNCCENKLTWNQVNQYKRRYELLSTEYKKVKLVKRR